MNLLFHFEPLEVWNLTKEMLGPSDRPKIKLKAKETEGLLEFVVDLLDFHIYKAILFSEVCFHFCFGWGWGT